MNKYFIQFLTLSVLISCTGNGVTQENGSLELTPVFSKLTFSYPVEFLPAVDGTDRIFIVEQGGKIMLIENKTDVASAKTFLDISSKIVSGGELGLLGLAFHPDFKNNGFFYVNYTRDNPLETVISRFKVLDNDKDLADLQSETELLTYAQPYSNHNGGKIEFGPDGYLYISAGDGGSGGDPQNNGQNLKTLLGKIMRIDVNAASGNLPYAIPDDNPFKGNTQGYREEIYAYGLRNAWKFSFDFTENRLWAADVGQNQIEEIDLIVKGGNYGWRIKEGTTCFRDNAECNKQDLIAPVFQYNQSSSTGRSITGGFVYRGSKIASLQGKYIYGDYVSGNIWALTYAGGETGQNELLFSTDIPVSSFGVDKNGEMYVCDHGEGKIYRLNQDSQD